MCLGRPKMAKVGHRITSVMAFIHDYIRSGLYGLYYDVLIALCHLMVCVLLIILYVILLYDNRTGVDQSIWLSFGYLRRRFLGESFGIYSQGDF